MKDAIKQALVDGVTAAVREAVVTSFNVYRQEHKRDLHQQERTANGLIEILLAAEEMLELIEEMSEPQARKDCKPKRPTPLGTL